jgi:hypothetical protein
MKLNLNSFFLRTTILFVAITNSAWSQIKELKKDEFDKLITEQCKKENGINFPIYKAVEYNDKLGKHFFIATESKDSISGKDTLNKKIKGIVLKLSGGVLKKEFEFTDFVSRNVPGDKEKNIWFWIKYINLEDLNKDSIADPIMVYGTHGINGYDDGRVKILIYYKGKKIAIRQQNGVLDYERSLQIESAFYQLPESIRKIVISEMKKIEQNRLTIFPGNWQQAMKLKKTKITNQ